MVAMAITTTNCNYIYNYNCNYNCNYNYETERG